jgi:hypothetical protein
MRGLSHFHLSASALQQREPPAVLVEIGSKYPSGATRVRPPQRRAEISAEEPPYKAVKGA